MAINGNFQFRRGLASLWTSTNPVLLSGELGLETDTDLFKIGDGVTAWNSLPYGGIKGDTGTAGRGIVSIVRTSGNGAAGTTDTYTINYTSAPLTSTFTVTNGANGINGQSVAVFDEGSQLTATAASINFVGGGVTATASGNNVTVTIPPNPTAANTAPPAIASTGSTGTTTNEYALEDHTHAGVTSVSVNGGAAQQGAVSVSIPTAADNTPQPIAATGSIGTVTTMYALEDHTHAGVTSITVNGGAPQQGAVTLTSGTDNGAVTRSSPTASASTVLTTIQSKPIAAGEITAGSEYQFIASLRVINTTTATNSVVTLSVGATNVLVLTQANGTTAAANPGKPVRIEGFITFLSATQAECSIRLFTSQAVAYDTIVNTSAPITVSAAGATTIDLKFNTSGATSTFIARQATIQRVK